MPSKPMKRPNIVIDGTYGYDETALLQVAVPEEPPGFAEFWTTLYEQALHVDVACQIRGGVEKDGVIVSEIRFTTLGGIRLGGWLAIPTDTEITQALIVGHGSDGRGRPELDLVPANTAAIFPVARGLPAASLVKGIPADPDQHVLHGIESVDTYIHGGCAADIWCAATALLEVLPRRPHRLSYIGNSFGGGIGALALPWDPRLTAGVLHLPSFGNHELRLKMPCTGSGEAVRRYVASDPAARPVLQFFDAAVAARRITVPMLVAPALWDPVVPPPGQFSIYNAIQTPKQLVVLSAGHADYPGATHEQDRYTNAVHAFLNAEH